MQYKVPRFLDSLGTADLDPLVAQSLAAPQARVRAWQVAPMGGGSAAYGEGGLGIYRVSGTAQTADSVVPWSLIAKGASSDVESGRSNPAEPRYWKRETLVYQSGMLTDLPGGLSAPQCFATHEPIADEWWLWLEDIREPSSKWTLEQFGLAARYLGRFNGAYLAGHPLPEVYPWLTRGRVCFELERQLDKLPVPAYAEASLSWQLLQFCQIDRMAKLFSYCDELNRALKRLPVCFCHLDAFRRNLFLRRDAIGLEEIVAIDWAYSGFAPVGEEIGWLTRISLIWMEAPAAQKKALSDLVFEEYLRGLGDVGWRGEAHLVRFGYAVTIAMGVRWLLFLMDIWQDTKNVSIAESIIGHPVEKQIEQLADLQPFLLEMSDEALSLIKSV